MKSTVVVAGIAVVCGLALGVAIAFVQSRPLEVSIESTNTQGAASDSGPEVGADEQLPAAQFDETIYNFGSMQRNTSLSHDFYVKNTGQSTLHIEVGSTTCKCTVGELATNSLAPGQETEIHLEWTAKTGAGPFRHGATLVTNDPKQPRVELVVEGDVVEAKMLRPQDFYFGNVPAGNTKQVEVFLMAFLQDEVKILSHQVHGENLEDQFDIEFVPCKPDELPEPEAHAGVKMVATFHAGTTIGPMVGSLAIETDLRETSKMDIPIMANVIGDLSIFGAGWIPREGLLRLGAFSSDKGKQARLNISIRGEHADDTKLEVASVRPKQLQASLGEPRKMKEGLVHVPLLVEVPPGTRPMARRGAEFDEVAEIVISTTNPQTPQLKLQVEFAVLP